MRIEEFTSGVMFGISIFSTVLKQVLENKKQYTGGMSMIGFIIGTMIGIGLCIGIEILISKNAIICQVIFKLLIDSYIIYLSP